MMKRSICRMWGVLVALLCACQMQAQNLKFGKPTDEEVRMTTCEQFPQADAVVLARQTTVTYDLSSDDYRPEYVVYEKVKVLKASGTDCANVEVLYRYDKKDQYDQEDVVDVRAMAYNVEDGQVGRASMPATLVFKERVNDYVMRCKFTIPQVKEGTLLEYEYRITSHRFYAIRDWYAQGELPVLFARLDCTIPVFFNFNMERSGLEPLQVEVKKASLQYRNSSGQRQAQTVAANRYVVTGRNLPPLRDDHFVYHAADYCARVTAELESMQLPNGASREYSRTWQQVDNTLLQHDDLGRRVGNGSKYSDELLAAGIGTLPTVEEKLRATYAFLKNRLSWDGTYEIVPREASAVMKKGSGSNADLNMLLINMLHDVGVKAVPVVMRTRNRGQLPMTFPSIDRLNTFIVGVEDGDQMLYIDASASTGYINALPPLLYSSQARIIEKGRCRWVDLQEVGSGKQTQMVNATLAADGTLSGTVETLYTGNAAADRRRELWQAADSAAFVAQLATDNGLQISACELTDHRAFAPTMKERLTFTRQCDATGDRIYLNPYVLAPLGESPFKEEKRLLPVEFPNQSAQTVMVNIALPEGYEVEELPKGASMTSEQGEISGRVVCRAAGDKLSVNFRFNVKSLHFAPDNYEALKQMYDHFSAACQDMVVLKKKE